MSFVLVEGFDYYNGGGTGAGAYRASEWVASGSGDWLTGTGRFGVGQRCRLGDVTGDTALLNRQLPGGAIGPNFAAGFAYSHASDGVSGLFYLRLGSTNKFVISYDGAQGYNLNRGSTNLGNTGPVHSTGGESDWLWFDLFGTMADAGGHVELWVNGVQKIVFDGDTLEGTGATIDNVLLRCPDGTGSANWANFDDLLISNQAVRIGDRRIDYYPVSADTATKAFTPSSGSDNYAMIDEALFATADYVEGAAVGTRDVYELSNAPAGMAVNAVQAVLLAAKTDAGTREARVQLVSGGAMAETAFSPGTTPAFYRGTIQEVDPNTAAPWTLSNFNAAKLGLEITV